MFLPQLKLILETKEPFPVERRITIATERLLVEELEQAVEQIMNCFPGLDVCVISIGQGCALEPKALFSIDIGEELLLVFTEQNQCRMEQEIPLLAQMLEVVVTPVEPQAKALYAAVVGESKGGDDRWEDLSWL